MSLTNQALVADSDGIRWATLLVSDKKKKDASHQSEAPHNC